MSCYKIRLVIRYVETIGIDIDTTFSPQTHSEALYSKQVCTLPFKEIR